MIEVDAPTIVWGQRYFSVSGTYSGHPVGPIAIVYAKLAAAEAHPFAHIPMAALVIDGARYVLRWNSNGPARAKASPAEEMANRHDLGEFMRQLLERMESPTP